MRLKSICRIVNSSLKERSLNESYWAFARSTQQIVRLLHSRNRAFAKVVFDDMRQFAMGVEPEKNGLPHRVEAAVRWLLYAQECAGNGGVSQGYFPCENDAEWRPAY